MNVAKNARLSDICISTSAAPTYLPAHYFETKDQVNGRTRSFNLIDGGIAANNPVSSLLDKLKCPVCPTSYLDFFFHKISSRLRL